MHAIYYRTTKNVLLCAARPLQMPLVILLVLTAFVTFNASPANGQFTSAGEPVTGFEIPNGVQSRAGEGIADQVTAGDPAIEQDTVLGSSSSLGVGSASKRLFDVLKSGGILMIPILFCSFVLVVFIFERLISLRKARVIPGPFSTRFLDQLENGDLNRQSAIDLCERNNSPIAQVFAAGVHKWGRPAVEVEQAVLDEGERTSSRLRSYLRLINGVATVCPLLGMLGTVLGMIHAFDAIATVDATMSDPKALIATGISQALLTTAAGMSVAIPALIAYLFFSSRVDKHVMEIDSLGMKVVNLISAETLSARKPTRSTKSKAA
jgi:biopolymer transport protein ExbB